MLGHEKREFSYYYCYNLNDFNADLIQVGFLMCGKNSHFMKVDVVPSGGQYVKEDVMIKIPLEKYVVHPTFTAGDGADKKTE